MKIAAFDSKKFWRFKRKLLKDGTEEMEVSFTSQLGIGVTIPDPEEFTRRYIAASQELAGEFGLDYSVPFLSSTYLKDHLSIFHASEFADRLVLGVRGLIESVHCSFVALPVTKMEYVETGGVRCPRRRASPAHFISSLGPAFSHLTALSYMWEYGESALKDLEMHIDAFTSKQTLAWDTLKRKASMKVFYKGDECNPFVSCADMVAFLVDSKLTTGGLILTPPHVRQVLKPYRVDASVLLLNQNSMDYYVWRENKVIDVSSHLKRPVVFLSMDSLNAGNPALEGDDREGRGQAKPDMRIRQTPVYQAALRYAYRNGGCMKLFSPAEDVAVIKSGDVFIHVGPNSERMGRQLQDTADIRVYAGREAIGLSEKPNNSVGN